MCVVATLPCSLNVDCSCTNTSTFPGGFLFYNYAIATIDDINVAIENGCHSMASIGCCLKMDKILRLQILALFISWEKCRNIVIALELSKL